MSHKLLNFEVKAGVAYIMWPTFKFWALLYIYGTAEDINFKFGALIDDKESYPKICKIRSNENMVQVT